MIAKERLRARRRLDARPLSERAIRMESGSGHLLLRLIGRSRTTNMSYVPKIRRLGPLTVNFARGSGHLGVGSGDPNRPLTALIFGFEKPEFVDTNVPKISATVAKGVTQITIGSGVVPFKGWYYLRDNKKTEKNESNPLQPFTRFCGGELVEVTDVSGASFPYTVTLAAATTQAYDAPGTNYEPILAKLPLGAFVTPYISVRGLHVVGERSSGFECWMIASLVGHFRLVKASSRNSYKTGYSIAYCRDVFVKHCTGRDFLTSGGGSAYGFQIDRCVNAFVNSCMMINARYGVTMEGGSAACTVNGFLPINCPDGAVDIHGGQGFDITFENVNAGDQVVTIGNATWRRGADNVTPQLPSVERWAETTFKKQEIYEIHENSQQFVA